jgi:hypothetical protein
VVLKAKAARDRIAQGIGLVSDDTGAGQAAQRGLRSWMGSSEERGGQLYDAIPIEPKTDAAVPNTRQALLEITKGMESNPKLSKLWTEHPQLKATLDALTPQPVTKTVGPEGYPAFQKLVPTGEMTGGKLSWEDLMRFRSIVGEISGQPSLADDGNKIKAMRKLYAALSEDMRATAAAQGPGALKAFTRANRFWRGREARIDGVLSDILGSDLNKGAAPAFAAIERLAGKRGGDPIRLARTLRSMPQDEANTVRATILSKMGQASEGRQDDMGEIFSPAEFVTNWNKMSDRAKGILFQGEHRKALDDIAKVYAGMKASSRYANTSKTGIALGATGTMSAAADGLLTGGMAIIAQFGAGKLLGSPRFARWLASYAKKPNPVAALSHINGLAKVARAEPALANEIFGLQQRLAEAFSSVPARAAADEPLNESGGVDGQDQ